MARKAIVDKEIILDMLRAGETTQHVAERFNVSRQAIDLHRKAFIHQGLIPDRRANRSTEKTEPGKRNGEDPEEYEIKSERQAILLEDKPSQTGKTVEDTISLDNQIDLMISAFSALKKLPALEQEIENVKRENEKARREIERLKAQERKRLEQENRWMLIRDDAG